MIGDSEDSSLFAEVIRQINLQKENLQSVISLLEGEAVKMNEIEAKLLASHRESRTAPAPAARQNEAAVAVKDSKPVLNGDAVKLKEGDFAVILHKPLQKLWSRGNPKTRSPLLSCGISGLRKGRRILLAHMLEHPAVFIGLHNIDSILNTLEPVSPSALAHTMRRFGEILCHERRRGPYITGQNFCGKGDIEQDVYGYAYRLASEFHYLVVLENFPSSSEIHRFVTRST
jgi:hypothetical protein